MKSENNSKTSNVKTLISNVIHLSIVQISNYILPLITIPYIVRIIGPEKFGIINFAQTFVSYFLIFTNFGVNLGGVREVAIVRDDTEKLSNVFSSYIFGRIYLSIIGFAIFCLLTLIIPKLYRDHLLFIITFGLVFTDALFPTWLFQGLEKMQYIALINLVTRFLSIAFTFILIREENDYIYIPLLNVISSLIGSITSISIAYNKFKLKFRILSFKTVYTYLRKNLNIYLSDIYVLTYTNSYPLVLGFLTNYTYVGYYTAAHKIIHAWLGLQNILIQTTFPIVSRSAHKSKEEAIAFLKKISVTCLIISIPSTILIYFYADYIVKVFLGENFRESVPVLKILSVLCILILMNVNLTFQGMLAFGKDKHFNYTRLIGGAVAISLVFPLSVHWKHIGTSITFVLSELGVFITSIYILSLWKINLLDIQQLKKIALFTAITLLTTLISLVMERKFFGILLTSLMILLTIHVIFGREYISRGNKRT